MADTSCHAPPSERGAAGGAVSVALAGNPNVGKSSLFNQLTGARQHVGNWPGKTVERRSGDCRRSSVPMSIIDLPGTYSLASSSPEEVVAEEVLMGPGVDAVAVVVDSTNLERNLYLAAQVAELGRPLLVVLNMSDVAEADGFDIDDGLLSRALGARVVRTTGRTGAGVDELVGELTSLVTGRDGSAAPAHPLRIDYGEAVETELRALEHLIDLRHLDGDVSARWLAARFLEGDATTEALTGTAAAEVVAAARSAAARVRDATGEEPALLLADHRFAWAHALASAAVQRETVLRSRTERLDDVLTSRWLGLPIFLGLMWMVFTLVTDVAGPFVDWTDGLVTGPVAALVRAGLSALGLGDTWVAALLVDGVLGGVGSVLVFVPVLAVLYLALGLLEDSGYMARAAFLLDRLMRPIGLTGKSFLPLLLGFGCNVPGVYATRVLDRRRDRIVTTLLLPFVSCAARLPVYVLLAAIFFPGARGVVVFTMYVASIAVVLLVGALLDRVLMRSERNDSFILELPAYRRPSRTILWRYTSERVKSFVARAGTVIFGCSMLVWLLLALPVRGGGSFADTGMEDSAFAGVARVVSPALAPAGLDSWQVAGTLVSGFVAKEVVVSTMDQTYGGHADSGDDPGVVASLGDSARSLGGTLRDAALAVPRMVGIHIGQWHHSDEPPIASAVRGDLDRSSSGHGSLAAAALLVIVLLYVPCMATVAAIRHEIGGRWAATSVALNLSVAWIASTALFQLGRALGLG